MVFQKAPPRGGTTVAVMPARPAGTCLGSGAWSLDRASGHSFATPGRCARIVPPAINTAVEMVKGTTLLSVIGVLEILLATQQAIARNYMVIEFYATAMAFYFVLNFSLSRVGAYFERRFGFIKY